jgi:hypothetical protein
LVQLVGSNPNFVYYFGDKKTGQPIPEYLEAVRKRFGQWIRDLCERDYDRDWLRYQLEIGLRHNRAKKNRTDGVDSVEHIPMRYMIAFIVPITLTVRPFLEKKGHPKEVVEKMHQAWFKAVTLSVALWCHPYAKRGETGDSVASLWAHSRQDDVVTPVLLEQVAEVDQRLAEADRSPRHLLELRLHPHKLLVGLVGDPDLGHGLGISMSLAEILSAPTGLRRSGGNPSSSVIRIYRRRP